jgi:hypothetical protein
MNAAAQDDFPLDLLGILGTWKSQEGFAAFRAATPGLW